MLRLSLLLLLLLLLLLFGKHATVPLQRNCWVGFFTQQLTQQKIQELNNTMQTKHLHGHPVCSRLNQVTEV